MNNHTGQAKHSAGLISCFLLFTDAKNYEQIPISLATQDGELLYLQYQLILLLCYSSFISFSHNFL